MVMGQGNVKGIAFSTKLIITIIRKRPSEQIDEVKYTIIILKSKTGILGRITKKGTSFLSYKTMHLTLIDKFEFVNRQIPYSSYF